MPFLASTLPDLVMTLVPPWVLIFSVLLSLSGCVVLFKGGRSALIRKFMKLAAILYLMAFVVSFLVVMASSDRDPLNGLWLVVIGLLPTLQLFIFYRMSRREGKPTWVPWLGLLIWLLPFQVLYYLLWK